MMKSMVREEHKRYPLGAWVTVNCASRLCTSEVIFDFAANHELIYPEFTDLPDQALLGKLLQVQPHLGVLFDDVPEWQWHLIPGVLEKFPNT